MRNAMKLFLILFLGSSTLLNAQRESGASLNYCATPCPCKGAYKQIKVYFFGPDNSTVDVFYTADATAPFITFNSVNKGDLLTIDAPGGAFSTYVYLRTTRPGEDPCFTKIYAQCPSEAWPMASNELKILGRTFDDFTVYAHTDQSNITECNLADIEQDWHVGGNVVASSNNTLGTRNNESVVLITNDLPRGIITQNGNFGLGTQTPGARLEVSGNSLLDGNLDVSGLARINNNTASTASNNGALVVQGGAGVGQNMNVGANLGVINNAAIGQNLNVGANLNVVNDAAIGQDLNVGDDLDVTDNAAIGQNLNVGANLGVNNNAVVGQNLNVGANLDVIGTATVDGFTTVNDNANITGNLELNGRLDLGSASQATIRYSAGNLYIENSVDAVRIAASSEEMLIINNTQVEAKKRLVVTGADLAERFTVNIPAETQVSKLQPGMVVSIDRENPGDLALSNNAYDKAVAGIVSGAGGINTAMELGQAGTLADGDVPVAIVGRVYCYVDASFGSIEPGDLLTTSPTPGHAMKVTDYAAAQGAVIGKAMTSLKDGKGMVLVLISMQ